VTLWHQGFAHVNRLAGIVATMEIRLAVNGTKIVIKSNSESTGRDAKSSMGARPGGLPDCFAVPSADEAALVSHASLAGRLGGNQEKGTKQESQHINETAGGAIRRPLRQSTSPVRTYGRLVTRTVTWAGAETGWNGQVGQGRTTIFTLDPKEWVSLAPPGGGGGKPAVNWR
jgi:hypothetical protein